MIEWLSSKFAMVLAFVLILSSLVSLFQMGQRAVESVELQTIMRRFASFVNTVCRSQGETTARISIGMDTGISLPSSINGHLYSIHIHSNFGYAALGSARHYEPFSCKLHFLEDMEYEEGLSFSVGETLVLEKRLASLGDKRELATLAFKLSESNRSRASKGVKGMEVPCPTDKGRSLPLVARQHQLDYEVLKVFSPVTSSELRNETKLPSRTIRFAFSKLKEKRIIGEKRRLGEAREKIFFGSRNQEN